MRKKKRKKTPAQTACIRVDKKAGKWFREDALCVACEVEMKSGGCKGPIQWCHIISRGYSFIRHSPLNAVPMCAAHHMYFTHAPHEWYLFIETLYPGRTELLTVTSRDWAGTKIDAYTHYELWYDEREDNFTEWNGEL